MDLRNKKILETGADGFICSHLTEKMVEKGYRVKVFVFCNAFNSWGRLDHSPRQIRDNLEIFAGDIRDPFGLDNAASDFDVIFHIAALIAPRLIWHPDHLCGHQYQQLLEHPPGSQKA